MRRSSKVRPQVISQVVFFLGFFFFIFCTVIEGIVAIFSRVKVVLLSVQIFSLLPWNPVETNGRLASLLSTE